MSSSADDAFGIKIVLLGDSGVGAKTSLLERFTKGIFRDDQHATIGAAFDTKTLEVDGIKVKLCFWGLHLNACR